MREALAISLVNRAELPVAEARAALDSPDPITAGLAARILGRAGTAAADAGKALEAALERWRQAWEEKRPAFDARFLGRRRTRADPLTSCLRSLVWAAGRLGVARDAARGRWRSHARTTPSTARSDARPCWHSPRRR